MQVSPDYSSQLEAIAKALNRPSTPTWVVSLISGFIGAISTLLVQTLLKRWEQRREMNKLRFVVYNDLAPVMLKLNRALERDTASDEVKKHLSFFGEEYMKDNIGTAVQLPDYPVMKSLYGWLHAIAQEDDWKTAAATAVELFVGFVRDGTIRKVYVERYIYLLEHH